MREPGRGTHQRSVAHSAIEYLDASHTLYPSDIDFRSVLGDVA